jgi:hypothetical protein
MVTAVSVTADAVNEVGGFMAGSKTGKLNCANEFAAKTREKPSKRKRITCCKIKAQLSNFTRGGL